MTQTVEHADEGQSLEADANVVWKACQNIRHGKNYGSQLADAGALTCYVEHHPHPRIRSIAYDARETIAQTFRPGPEAA